MSIPHDYVKTINRPNAFNVYITTNISWMDAFDGINMTGNQITINSTRVLTIEEQDQLDTLVTNYVDPPYHLVYSDSISASMDTIFTSDPGLVIEGKRVLQTFIFSISDEPAKVIDSIKTVVQYHCLDVSDPPVNGEIDVLIWDMTRDTLIAEINCPLDEIQTKWDDMNSQTLTGPDTVFKTLMIEGLSTLTPDHACVWQIRGSTNSSKFDFKLNGLQTIYYFVE